jgi:hypothetical protein
MKSMNVLPFNRGQPWTESLPRAARKLRLYDRDSLPRDVDSVQEQARERFEDAVQVLLSSSRWETVRVQVGRTRGYRFVYLVLRERGATADEEAKVASVTFTPADLGPQSRVRVEADVSGEESGQLLFELPAEDVLVSEASEAGLRVADALVRWLSTASPER